MREDTKEVVKIMLGCVTVISFVLWLFAFGEYSNREVYCSAKMDTIILGSRVVAFAGIPMRAVICALTMPLENDNIGR